MAGSSCLPSSKATSGQDVLQKWLIVQWVESPGSQLRLQTIGCQRQATPFEFLTVGIQFAQGFSMKQEFSDALESCAFWGKCVLLDGCHIIVSKKVTLIMLGHEFSHCLFDTWH